jgi:hypothetical protein
MGFFSYNCHECEHPLLSPQATSGRNRWMSDAVTVNKRGDIHTGEYDGYGRVGGAESAADSATVWHRACWERAGKPMDYCGDADNAADQGWWFEHGQHDLPDPRISPSAFRAALVDCARYNPDDFECAECGERFPLENHAGDDMCEPCHEEVFDDEDLDD